MLIETAAWRLSLIAGKEQDDLEFKDVKEAWLQWAHGCFGFEYFALHATENEL